MGDAMRVDSTSSVPQACETGASIPDGRHDKERLDEVDDAGDEREAQLLLGVGLALLQAVCLIASVCCIFACPENAQERLQGGERLGRLMRQSRQLPEVDQRLKGEDEARETKRQGEPGDIARIEGPLEMLKAIHRSR